jgi:hypothetical protein
MSVFRNAKKIERGALPDEEDDSDDDDESLASGDEGGESGSDGSDSEDDTEQRAGKKRKASDEDSVKAGMKWVKPGRATEASDSDDDGSEEDNEDDEDEDGDKEISFPAQCSLCKKTLFNMGQLNDHMKSKGHAKKQKVFDKGKIAFFRTPAQIAKLKERNQRKKDRKFAKKKEQKAVKGHVWGEHKKPPKSREQRAAEAAAAQKASPLASKLAGKKDKRTRAEKRASARGGMVEAIAGKGKHHAAEGKGSKARSDFESLPKQQGKRKNRA